MSKLHKISSKRTQPGLGAVIFVHGLGGDAFATWRKGKESSSFWPQWLAEDLEQLDVYSLSYEASPVAWLGTTMPIFDRAKQILTWLEPLSERPIVFICHSLGGLLVKQMIRLASTGGFANWRALANQTRGVVFLGTPHTGADIAGTLDRLGAILGTSVSMTELAKNSPHLRDINEWYRNSARPLNIKTLPFYEKQPTHGILVVDETAADPTIESVAAIPLDGTHLTMCKPESREDFLYVTVERFVRSCFRAELSEQELLPNGQADSTGLSRVSPALHSESTSEKWLLGIKNYPAVKPYEIPFEAIKAFARAYPTLPAAKNFINGVNALRIKLNPENNTEQQILVEPHDLGMSPGNFIDFWTEVLTLAGHKSRRTLATFTVAPNAPNPALYGPEATHAFNELRRTLESLE
ncbi:hypothetical protein HZZ13_33960 [Bradyrhizobium sp. CNPSo 4010]|uniref:Alpha/beta hydrolase n=1 Tax=Bradyrhizobium agreste TaxID=2751811 RepID=A0ABS0PZV7_9BRAD|nr:hypothetical protein [Bradyrhizobium agreste]MBH5402765.1 hypothetical protein [Bradyrhizobium agreste]